MAPSPHDVARADSQPRSWGSSARPCSSCSAVRRPPRAARGLGVERRHRPRPLRERVRGRLRGDRAQARAHRRARRLVVLSDTAYQLLPPGSSGREFQPLLRFFRSSATGFLPPNPWERFRAGTRISEGLKIARESLVREGQRGGTLDPHQRPGDSSGRGTAARRGVRGPAPRGLRGRIVASTPRPEQRRLMEQLLGDQSLLPEPQSGKEALRAPGVASPPVYRGPFRWLASSSSLVLAANERVLARLEVTPMTRRSEATRSEPSPRCRWRSSLRIVAVDALRTPGWLSTDDARFQTRAMARSGSVDRAWTSGDACAHPHARYRRGPRRIAGTVALFAKLNPERQSQLIDPAQEYLAALPSGSS